ncbi:MAG: riboflavin synthase [bacterium]
MFTGLIEEIGKVLHLEGGERARLTIQAQETLKDLAPGSSIAVNGACLTVSHLLESSFTADLSPETLKVTNLGEVCAGEGVNLERPLRLGDRLGGHWVSGHIDGVGTIRERAPSADFIRLSFSYPSFMGQWLVPKGSVAVDGISLTLVEVKQDSFTVQLIPFTSRQTTLGGKRVGERVNLEADLVAKYIQSLLSPYQGLGAGRGIDRNFLSQHGFLRE